MDTAPSPNSSPRARLTGWKEIAAYFDRGVRTVQRWERELGLPIRRMGTGRAETVYALTEELERWQRGLERRTDLSTQPGEEDPLASTEAVPAATSIARASVLGWKRPLLAAAVVVAAVAVALGTYLLRPAGEPASHTLEVNRLHILDASGREVWSYGFPQALPTMRPPWGFSYRREPLFIDDFDQNGRRDVVMMAPEKDRSVFHWFEGDTGKVRYRYQPEVTVHFGSNEYASPWISDRMFVADGPAGPEIWGVWMHYASGQFPSIVKRMTPSGPSDETYWAAGYPDAVAYAVVAGRPSILIGGSNNDSRGAGLAVLDYGAVRGAAPAANFDKQCRDCGAGGPRYFLDFPALDTERVGGGVPAVIGIRSDNKGGLQVTVRQGVNFKVNSQPESAVVFYWFDATLRLLRAEVSEQFGPLHARFEEAGLLKHPFGPADAEELLPIHYWDGRQYAPLRIGDAPKPIPR